jgi:uncharacterized OsmC-like protein
MDLLTVRPDDRGQISIELRGHRLLMERSPAEGGKDMAPTPVEMTVASLGACIGLMVGDYCRRAGYREGAVALFLTYQMGGSPRRIEAITIDLEIPRDVPAEKREAILRVARHCPVHQSLHQPPRIDIEIV